MHDSSKDASPMHDIKVNNTASMQSLCKEFRQADFSSPQFNIWECHTYLLKIKQSHQSSLAVRMTIAVECGVNVFLVISSSRVHSSTKLDPDCNVLYSCVYIVLLDCRSNKSLALLGHRVALSTTLWDLRLRAGWSRVSYETTVLTARLSLPVHSPDSKRHRLLMVIALFESYPFRLKLMPMTSVRYLSSSLPSIIDAQRWIYSNFLFVSRRKSQRGRPIYIRSKSGVRAMEIGRGTIFSASRRIAFILGSSASQST